MNKLLNERLSVIVSILLGTGAGWRISAYIAAVEIKQWLTSIAIAFSILISLLISAYYKSNRRRIRKPKFWKYSIISTIMFIAMLIAFFTSYNTFETRLFVNTLTIDNRTETIDSVFIKGLYFTNDAKNEVKKIKQNNPKADIDLRVIFSDSGNDIDNVWSKTSRTIAKIIILLSYIFFIASLVASITITIEILKEDKAKANLIISSQPDLRQVARRAEGSIIQRAFICYSSIDSVDANRIVSRLENSGIDCWIAPRDIPSGSTYAASIVKGIKNSNLFIFVYTKSSNNSEAVINEIEKANSLKIRIIPFKIDNDEYSDSLEYYLRSKQSITAYGKPLNEAINELIESINRTLPHTPPVPGPKPKNDN